METIHKQKDFAHLHVHTEYSLLDGANKTEKLAELAASNGQKAISITDHGNMYGALDFYNACKKVNIKPIIGCEVYIAKLGRRRRHTKLNGYNHLTLLAANEEGLRNLYYLSSISFIEGLATRPRIDAELLYNNSKGIICLSGCLSSLINEYLRQDDFSAAEEQLATFMDVFGKENTFVEVQRNGIDIQDKCNEGLFKLSQRLGLPVVATNDIHFLRKESCDFHDTLLCVSTNAFKSEAKRFRFDTDDVYVKSTEEMYHTFRDCDPSILSRTVEIAERINCEIKQGKPIFPRFDTGEETSQEYLGRLVRQGIRRRFKGVGEEEAKRIDERVDYELSVISDMGFDEYFLSVKDFVDFSRSNSIPVGPGRGSAAGSIVSYALGITSVDPLRHGLLFERFLNPERSSLPDIDIDFCKERRDEVIQYLEEAHGCDKVARILTVGRFGAKNALRASCRVHGLPINESDTIAKRLSDDLSIEESLEQDPLLREDATKHPKIFADAKDLQGFASSVGVHASGVVVSRDEIYKLLPLARSKHGHITTQWDGESCEKIGLVKFDFLGLQTLTAISICIKLIKNRHGKDIDLDDIDLDDPNLYSVYQGGKTEGIFQCYSGGMRNLLNSINPDRFGDISAALALFRPGPIESGIASSYCKRKAGKEKVEYIHPDAQRYLEDTYGLMVYQEQIMQLSQVLAGFTPSEADDLRKAVGKKKPEELEKLEEKWLNGIKITQKISEAQGIQLFNDIKKFGRYGFNKSHSVAYAVISIWTAYLKFYYPVEFFTANMSVEGRAGDIDKLRAFIYDAKEHGINVLPPDLRDCSWDFKIESDTIIRQGLSGIAGLGEDVSKAYETRKLDKSATYSVIDIFDHFDGRVAKKNVIEALDKSGALDFLDLERGLVTQKSADIVKELKRLRDRRRLNKSAEPKEIKFDNVVPWNKREKQAAEREVYKFYLTSHPMDDIKYAAAMARTLTIEDVKELTTIKRNVKLAGVIVSIDVSTVKKGKNIGKKYATIMFEDHTSNISIIIFAKMYSLCADQLRDHFQNGEPIVITGDVITGGSENQLSLNEFRKLETEIDVTDPIVPLSSIVNLSTVSKLLKLADNNPGDKELKFKVLGNNGESVIINTGKYITLTESFQKFLIDMF